MNSIRFHHHTSENFLDELKISALYFEKIEVPVFTSGYLQQVALDSKKYRYFEKHRSATDIYLENIKILEKENILKIDKIDYDNTWNGDGKGNIDIFSFENNIAALVVMRGLKKFFKNPVIFKNPIHGGIETSGDYIEEIELYNSSIEKEFTYNEFPIKYVISQLTSILKDINEGKVCINTSPLIDSFVKDYFSHEKFKSAQDEVKKFKNIEAKVAIEALKLNLPNISLLPFEDIIELKTRMKDELLAFQTEMKQLTFEYSSFSNEDNFSLLINEFVKVRVNPKVLDLERKLHSLDLKFLKNIMAEVKDPKSYSPLLLSFFNNISNTLIVLISMGLITTKAAMDYYEENQAIKKDGLYYLIKLKQA